MAQNASSYLSPFERSLQSGGTGIVILLHVTIHPRGLRSRAYGPTAQGLGLDLEPQPLALADDLSQVRPASTITRLGRLGPGLGPACLMPRDLPHTPARFHPVPAPVWVSVVGVLFTSPDLGS